MIKDIQSLTWNQSLTATFSFLSVISPGFLTLYLFKPELVSDLDIFKTVIFSLSLSLPIFVVNAFVMFGVVPESESVESLDLALMSMFLSAAVSYPSILITYLSNYSFVHFLFVLLILQVIAIIVILVLNRMFSKK